MTWARLGRRTNGRVPHSTSLVRHATQAPRRPRSVLRRTMPRGSGAGPRGGAMKQTADRGGVARPSPRAAPHGRTRPDARDRRRATREVAPRPPRSRSPSGSRSTPGWRTRWISPLRPGSSRFAHLQAVSYGPLNVAPDGSGGDTQPVCDLDVRQPLQAIEEKGVPASG